MKAVENGTERDDVLQQAALEKTIESVEKAGITPSPDRYPHYYAAVL